MACLQVKLCVAISERFKTALVFKDLKALYKCSDLFCVLLLSSERQNRSRCPEIVSSGRAICVETRSPTVAQISDRDQSHGRPRHAHSTGQSCQ